MNVLVIEMGGSHIECTYSFVHFLQLKSHCAHLACNKKLLGLFPERDKLSGILPLPDEFNMLSQLITFFQIRKYITEQKIDTLVINTTELKIIRNLSFFIPKRINCTGLVHNAGKIEKSSTFEKILSKKIRKYFVLGDHLLHNTKVNPLFEALAFYPIYFPKPGKSLIAKPENEFWVVVPGEANQFRRDYSSLIAQIKKSTALQQIKFIFLGKNMLEGKEGFEFLKSNRSISNVLTFDSQVDYDTFHTYIELCDAILPLIKISDDKMYGNNRISGSFNLGLGYKKPFLLPTSVNNSDLRPFSIYYDDMNQLEEQLLLLKDSNIIREKISDAYKNSKFNNVELLAEETYSFIYKNMRNERRNG